MFAVTVTSAQLLVTFSFWLLLPGAPPLKPRARRMAGLLTQPLTSMGGFRNVKAAFGALTRSLDISSATSASGISKLLQSN